MSGFLVAAAIASTAISLYGQKKEAEAEDRRLKEKARLQGIQADEMLSRAAINKRQMEREGEKLLSDFGAAAGMRRGSSFTAIRGELAQDILENIQFEQRVAEFDASMMRLGQEQIRQESSDTRRAYKYQSMATVLGGGLKAASAAKK